MLFHQFGQKSLQKTILAKNHYTKQYWPKITTQNNMNYHSPKGSSTTKQECLAMLYRTNSVTILLELPQLWCWGLILIYQIFLRDRIWVPDAIRTLNRESLFYETLKTVAIQICKILFYSFSHSFIEACL